MERTFGWVGKFLRIDLSKGKIEEGDTLDYAPSFIGGRGIATKIGWDEIPPGVGPFDPENPLIFFTGPLTGTNAPFSGRVTVSAVSPQTYPKEWFTRSSMGGHWGPELKYAGYDGLVITGKAEEPAYLWLHDGQAQIRSAKELWGLGTYATQEALTGELGPGVRVVAIGQAGENLSRIAVINSETESAAGQGGFGAVMGSKNLKAIAVKGTGAIAIARPEEFFLRTLAIAKEAHAPHGSPRHRRLRLEAAAKYGQKFQACSQGCTVRCTQYFSRVPGVVHKGAMYSGQLHCVAGRFPGGGRGLPYYDWGIGFEAGFEVSKFANDYGINHWDFILGIVTFLTGCKESGEMTEIDGVPIDFNDPEFWLTLLRKIAYREGPAGDALAEGGRRASDILGKGGDFINDLYPAWGCPEHWDGHMPYGNYLVFPYWLVAALQWAMDSRDPMGSGHGYAQNIMGWAPFREIEGGPTWEDIITIGKKVYGTEAAFDPKSGYKDKAIPAIWHGHRTILKDSVPVCDNMFPRIFSLYTPDHFARADGMEGPDFEYHMLVSATGLEISKEDLDGICERIFNLDRALLVRNWGRSRQDDETLIPYFEREEAWVNPLLGEKKRMDREKFLRLMDEYYELRGWDMKTGRPLRAKLERLGLKYAADDLESRALLPG